MPVPSEKQPALLPSTLAGLRDSAARLVGEVGGGPPADETLLALDSLGLVELVVKLEEHFRIEIPDWILNDRVFASIDNLAAMLAEVGTGCHQSTSPGASTPRDTRP